MFAGNNEPIYTGSTAYGVAGALLLAVWLLRGETGANSLWRRMDNAGLRHSHQAGLSTYINITLAGNNLELQGFLDVQIDPALPVPRNRGEESYRRLSPGGKMPAGLQRNND